MVETYSHHASKALRLAVRISQLAEAKAHLTAAMESRTTIDLATGAIMAQNRCSQETGHQDPENRFQHPERQTPGHRRISRRFDITGPESPDALRRVRTLFKRPEENRCGCQCSGFGPAAPRPPGAMAVAGGVHHGQTVAARSSRGMGADVSARAEPATHRCPPARPVGRRRPRRWIHSGLTRRADLKLTLRLLARPRTYTPDHDHPHGTAGPGGTPLACRHRPSHRAGALRDAAHDVPSGGTLLRRCRRPSAADSAYCPESTQAGPRNPLVKVPFCRPGVVACRGQ